MSSITKKACDLLPRRRTIPSYGNAHPVLESTSRMTMQAETMHTHPHDNDLALDEMQLDARIDRYRREIAELTPPATFREEVLVNVYRCLLQRYDEQQHANRQAVS
ncbi:hypothetical protein [Marichromatium bheemlicum]|uniref:Uncharacterized protein n=1 Tax=Marichromatium bheemlicum TaxID=365339 RepID=A0ABX1I716_9GAMM|nr:hypothetical protein [Marichromatium bheemlicum]NKN33358.1 hypothetical protein [Marichromatium bheemlicum]